MFSIANSRYTHSLRASGVPDAPSGQRRPQEQKPTEGRRILRRARGSQVYRSRALWAALTSAVVFLGWIGSASALDPLPLTSDGATEALAEVAEPVEPVADLAEPVAETVEPVVETVEPVAETVEPVAETSSRSPRRSSRSPRPLSRSPRRSSRSPRQSSRSPRQLSRSRDG